MPCFLVAELWDPEFLRLTSSKAHYYCGLLRSVLIYSCFSGYAAKKKIIKKKKTKIWQQFNSITTSWLPPRSPAPFRISDIANGYHKIRNEQTINNYHLAYSNSYCHRKHQYFLHTTGVSDRWFPRTSRYKEKIIQERKIFS